MRAFVLFLVLASLIGLCAVHESVMQTRAQYAIGRQIAKEEALKQELGRLQTEYTRLTNPHRLEWLIRQRRMQVQPLPAIESAPATARRR